jgi:carbonic anhydrase
MSCTAPIDLSQKSAGKCSLKCLLWYNYGDSSCTISTGTDKLTIPYDGASDVMYNSVKYNPTEIRIYSPSLHTFDGVHAEAEILIVHSSSSSDGLIIGIPISSSTNAVASTSSVLVDEIIANAPDHGESSTVSLPKFNLNYIIPKGGYFSYAGSAPFDGCQTGVAYNYVVFQKTALIINASSLTALRKLIIDSYLQIRPGKCFWNEKGTSTNGFAGEGQIYIDCQPTGEEGEIIYKETPMPKSSINMNWVKTVMYVLLGICIIWIGLVLFNGTISFIKTLSADIKKET